MLIRKRSKAERMGTRAYLSLRERIEDLDGKQVAVLAGAAFVTLAAFGIRRVLTR